MEGIITTISAQKRPAASPSTSPNKKTNFVGIPPLRELTNVKTPTDRPFRGIETYGEPIEWWRNLEGYNLLDLMYSDIHKWLKVFQSYVQFTRLTVQTTKPKSSTTVQMFERLIQNNSVRKSESRARPEKNGLSLQYLTELHESHERWLMTDDERFNTIPVLVLDANKTLEEIVME
ncbi:hypothetical protein NQ314_002867 [Rhamnusium bicolor]|uniref:Deoxynucleoside kinase domain-containing protein n=1 Tax=Rhamnusium bicolor TaxID=1586634 RepID=A0AAV8ZRA7_9CUCU|nr:hypothetical protein NQ314_002867 [Rhamnusium bicolor]